ncbi:hypothetical protein QVD17_04679 [Tagetes erecta]|uniref:Uncharacterized protein n=1 Tax=Tagetes erecta TaxID=13708 RepID=A0AAD8LI91_TARER|nr:hypothetical protein QVD17_04679 [Tagetes erecta]
MKSDTNRSVKLFDSSFCNEKQMLPSQNISIPAGTGMQSKQNLFDTNRNMFDKRMKTLHLQREMTSLYVY